MRRVLIKPRENWQQRVEMVGLLYHSLDNTYWNESAYYEFELTQIDLLESATNTLHKMCLDAVQYVIDNNLFKRLAISDRFAEAIKQSWETEPPSVYGRFDFAYDGYNPPKMLEYNADTPTSLMEASVTQWYWLQEVFPFSDQFNSIHEKLVAKWKELGGYVDSPMYFAHLDNPEDFLTTVYMMNTAVEAGLNCQLIRMEDIGWDGFSFVDLEDQPISSIFKLYPWEGMLYDEFGPRVLETANRVQWIEPAWKAVLSNKGILPVLWEMYPNHPYLLEAYFDGPKDLREHVRKPLLSREGANITIQTGGNVLTTGGEYGGEGHIYQKFTKLPEFDGNYAVIGSWVIDGEAAGIGVRESDELITTNISRFVPHRFD